MNALVTTPPTVVLVDARALQDRDYRYRGVGQHSLVILQALRFNNWHGRRPRLVALTDKLLEELASEHAVLFDEVTTPGIPAPEGALFLCLSPMTHDPIWALKYLIDPKILKVSLFYDLIQLQFPERYLASLDSQMGFILNLAWLRKYDAFSAISEFARDELCLKAGVAKERTAVSFVAVRRGLEPDRDVISIEFRQRGYVLFAGGGDPRKNPDCAVLAHARSRKLRKAGVGLVLFGNYNESTRNALRRLCAVNGGRPSDLKFLAHVADEELRRFYAGAIVTIVASEAEGFSIPIVESSAAGTPVLASNVGAHPELLTDPDHRFDPLNPEELRVKMEAFCTDESAWNEIRDRQSGLWKSFTIERVSENFLRGLSSIPRPVQKPAVHKGSARPSLSLLSPLPPAASGVADYSAATFEALGRKADLHVYTSIAGVKPQPWFASLNAMGQARFSARRSDATVAVIGNSHFHEAELDYVIDTGCAVIAHDARMIDYYFHIAGLEKCLKLASVESKRSIDEIELRDWLHHQERLPVLFLSEIARRASPFFVHSPATAELINEQYGKRPIVLPFAHYNGLDLQNATAEVRKRVRRSLGWSEHDIHLCTFGYVSDDKAPDELIWSSKILRDWKLPIKLHFCGAAHHGTSERLNNLIAILGLGDDVSIAKEFISPSQYRNLLYAADVGVQLRTYFMGALSGALNDCIAAALPSVANEHLAEAMLAPSFVRRVPDKLSPILIAEAVLDIINTGENRKRPIDIAAACATDRSPDAYADAMLAGLGLR